ncbi:MAG: lipase [Prevotella sp.]|nr:lipase [Prevotella sp.]
MNTRISLLLLVVTFLMGPAVAQTFIPADDPNLSYIGRTSHRNPKAVAFTYPGIQIRAVFQGSSVAMKTKPGSGFFMIELDDQAPFKVESTKEDSIVRIAAHLPAPSGTALPEHRLTITYINEGLLMKPVFYGLLLDSGCSLPRNPRLPRHNIEFIGNSITCGLGNEGDNSDKKHTYAKQNQYYTYAAIASRELDAQCWVVARSGMGIYRNTLGNPKGDAKNLQAYYPYTLFGTDGERWDFRRNTPDVVCINLGTNDTTNPSYDVSLLAAAYVRFIHTIRSHYPKAKIVLLTGTMVRGKRLEDIQTAQRQAMTELEKKGEHLVWRFDFTPDDGSLGYGMFKHPNVARNRKMASELVPFLKKLMNW